MEWHIVGVEMYRLRVKTHFDAAHKLDNYEGKCSNLHGHRWKVEVFVKGEKLNETGLLLDFSNLKSKLNSIVEELDHAFLNEIKEIGNPTAENLSRYVYQRLREFQVSVKLEKVRVWESPESWAEYIELKE
jgi:6-pyruvoyltetrahydropterin/6-carboxytetrahydropterin synthase